MNQDACGGLRLGYNNREGGENMTVTDCKAVFSLQREILKNKKLTAEDKVQMLEASINATIGKEIEDEK